MALSIWEQVYLMTSLVLWFKMLGCVSLVVVLKFCMCVCRIFFFGLI